MIAFGAATLNYGVFLNTIIDFLIVAFAVFLLVQQANKLKRQPSPLSLPESKVCPHCLSTIAKQATKCAHCTSELAP